MTNEERQQLIDKQKQINAQVADVGREIIASFGNITPEAQEELHQLEQTLKRQSKDIGERLAAEAP